ncbi:hypothetical protein [Asticcacaulis sp. AC402]|uniref:hypothetical protein n=1 Tax=Asticcacaulis sp. AC402 TaxID=1282361 RepID=UPI0003C3B989|nr:hypothetical protein [Asticcacaulis sp. AC402]ESQ77103.1 hypothetical protein ABAC402_01520 [Asticcacaulis sp. AC402]
MRLFAATLALAPIFLAPIFLAPIFLAPIFLATAGVAAAQAPLVPAGLNVFFSPAGQPFRAKSSDPYPKDAWFTQADRDKDGKISHEEFLIDSMAFFILLDQNKDTVINSPENTRYETQVAPEITRVDPRIRQPKVFVRKSDPTMDIDRGAAQNRYVKTVQGASQYSLIDEPQPVRAADSNLDFKVSDVEWVAASEQRFSILDANGDGGIALEELTKTPAQVAAEAPHDGKPNKNKKKRIYRGDDRSAE